MRQLHQECNDRTQSLVAMCRPTGRHDGHLQSILDNPKQLRRAPISGMLREVRRAGPQALTDFGTGNAWRPVASLAALLEVPSALLNHRSEERRVGKECVSTCRYRGSPSHEKKKLSANRQGH